MIQDFFLLESDSLVNLLFGLSHLRAGKAQECDGWDSFQSGVWELKQDPICLRNKDLWHYLCGTSEPGAAHTDRTIKSHAHVLYIHDPI